MVPSAPAGAGFRMHPPYPTLDRAALDAGFRIGAFRVEPRLQRVVPDDGPPVALEPRVMEVLVRLAQEPGHPVAKDVLLDELWPGVVVTDDALLRCIGELRRALGDDARVPRYIETIRKRGYRLIAPVALAPSPASPAAPAPPDDAPSAAGARVRWSVLLVALGAAAVGAGAFALWPGRSPAPEPAAPLRAVPLTSFPGVERDPQLSPDGTALAFTWDGGDGGSTDLYVLQVGQGTPLRLTDTPEDEASPAWSPDGQRVAFVRGPAVFVVPVMGGVERRLADLGARALREVAWAPGGEALVISAATEPGGPFGLVRLPLDTLRPVALTTPPAEAVGDLHPAVSPDGRRVAFVRSVTERSDDVFVVDLAGGEPRRLTSDHAEVSGLDWSRDGRRVVVASERGGSAALWSVPLDGAAPTWVPTAGEGRGVQQPTLARRTGRLAFVQRDEETNLWAVPLDSAAAPEAPLVASTRWDSHPALSPDGQRLAFVSDRSGDPEVWVSWADGVDPYPATALGGAFVSTPRWSPDGRRIAFVATSAGSADVYVVDAAGGRPLRITTVDANDRAPAWSRDGRTLYFASARSGRWEVWTRPADGTGGPTQVTDVGASSAQEAVDGPFLYLTRTRADGLWRRPLAGGPLELVVPSLRAGDWANWAVTSAGVVYVRRDGAAAELRRWDPATGRDEALAALDRFPAHAALAVSADGARVVVTRLDRDGSDVLLVEDVD